MYRRYRTHGPNFSALAYFAMRWLLGQWVQPYLQGGIMQLRSTCKTLVMAAVILAFGPAAYAQNPVPQTQAQAIQNQSAAVMAAASQDLTQFIEHNKQRGGTALPEGFPLDVANLAELQSVRVAYGFPIYTIDPQRLVAGETDLSAMATPTGGWRTVLYRSGKPVGLAKLEKIDGQWKTVAYGAMALSRDVDSVTKTHGNAARSNMRFIRVFQAQSDLVEVAGSGGASPRFVLMPSAQQSILQQHPGTLRSEAMAAPTASLMASKDFIEPLRQAVKATLAN
jgi:hypothetical protein